MTTLLLTHPCFVDHDTGQGHPERPDRMRAIDKVLGHELFNGLKREPAPLREDVEDAIALAHPHEYIEWVKSVPLPPPKTEVTSSETPFHWTALGKLNWPPSGAIASCKRLPGR